jgi:hypothetical protein
MTDAGSNDEPRRDRRVLGVAEKAVLAGINGAGISAWCADSSSFQRLRIKAIQKSPLPKNFNVLGNRIANGIREKQRGEHWLVESRMTTRPRQVFGVSGSASF